MNDTTNQVPAGADVPAETQAAETQAVAPAATEAVAEAKPVAVGGKKAKAQGTGDLISDIAVEVENLTKTKALNLAETLAETVETSYFKLGGVLKVIKDNTWFDGFESFELFVVERYGFAARKAAYLIQIYTDLVTKQIPWAKVAGLGWTKLKDLSPILTLENVDEWVAKAEKLTVLELQNVLKATPGAEAATKTTDEFVKFSLKLKPDQKSMVDTAIAKAKGELNTEFESVALENICAAYVAGAGGMVTTDTSSVEAFVKTADMMAVLEALAAQHPEYDISVQKATAPAAA